MSLLEDAAKAFITEGMNSSQVKGAMVMSWRVIVLVHVAWACGYLAWLGVGSGFAHADTQVEIRIQDLEERMVATRILQCEAIDAGKSTIVYTERLNSLFKRRLALTKDPFNLPTCQELR